MSLISKLLDAVHLWRQRRGARPKKVNPRAAVALEQLDHRQLLAVAFTGIVTNDFPASLTPGVVVLPDTPNVTHPTFGSPDLQNLVKVSGFDISGLRVTYDATDDTLNVGIEQPLSQQPGRTTLPVIASDADNNGDSGTTNPAVQAVEPGFVDEPDMGGSEFMGVYLDLNHTGFADVVAGFSPTDLTQPKPYEVALAIPNTTTGFGAPLPQFTGNYYLVNSPQHPNLELQITHFSQLFFQITGTQLTPGATFGLGAFGGSGEDIGISEAFFPEQPVNVGAATLVTPPPPPPPPVSPMILINPHSQRHVNTAHPDVIRVNVFGTSGFHVNEIIPSTVTLGGAHPIAWFTRNVNRDEWPDETFVFQAQQVNLPAGISEATVSGQLTTGGTFSSSSQIFNRNDSFYTPGAIVAQQARQGLRQFLDSPAGSPGLDNAQARVVSRLSSTPLHVDYGAAASSTVMRKPTARPVSVSIPMHSTAGNLRVDYGAATPPSAANSTARPSSVSIPMRGAAPTLRVNYNTSTSANSATNTSSSTPGGAG